MGHAIVLMKCEGKFYTVVNQDNSISAFKSVEDGLASFENIYDRKHNSYEGSMSACINWMTFQPAILWFEDVAAIRNTLFAGVKDEDIRVYHHTHVSGGFRGLLCGPEAESYWNAARKPALITTSAF